jgi:hypothetical protein
MDKTGKVELSLEHYDALKSKEISFEKIAKEFNEYKGEELKMLMVFVLRLKDKIPYEEMEDAMTKAGYTFKYLTKTGHSFTLGKGDKIITRQE